MKRMLGLFCAVASGIAAEAGRDTVNPSADSGSTPFPAGRFRWTASAPLVSPALRPDDPCYSVKDPSIVRYQDRWHLFCTIRSQKRSHQIEYLSFDDWKNADAAPRHVLQLTNNYFCAPQVFYFTPHRKWYSRK